MQSSPQPGLLRTSPPSRALRSKIVTVCLALAVSLGLAGVQAVDARVEPSSPDGPTLPGLAPPTLPTPSPQLIEERLERTRERLASMRAAEGDALAPNRDPAHKPVEPRTDRLLGGNVRNVTTGDTYATLDAAVQDATAGDILQVETAVLPQGQIVIDRSLTLRGETGTEQIVASESTGNSGDDRAWFLVEAGVDFNVLELAFDGTGQSIYHAFRIRGSGSFTDVDFSNIEFEAGGPSFAGFGIVAFGDGPVDVLSCSFSQMGRVGVLYFGGDVSGSIARGNSYVGKGDGTFLDYGFEVGAGAVVALVENDVRANRGSEPTSGSDSAGFLLTTFFGAGTSVLAEDNNLTLNTLGIAIGAASDDTSSLDARENRFVGNTTGIGNEGSTSADAERQWWGCNGGPGSLGCDTVAGLVDADPWLILRFLPPLLCASEDVPLYADLRGDSDGGVTNRPILPVAPEFVATFTNGALGTVDPLVAPVIGGVASTTYQSPPAGADDMMTATVDNETVAQTFTTLDTVFCDGFESGDTSAWDGSIP